MSGRYATVVLRLRWWVVGAWAVALGLLTWLAPPFGAGSDQVAAIIPLHSAALQNEERAVQAFGYPLTSRILVVQRDPAGLSPFTQAAAVLEAVSVNQEPQRYPLLGAVPVTNTVPVLPGSGEHGTAVVTYLFMDPGASVRTQSAAARRYVAEHLDHPQDAVVGIAGSIPARDEQARLVARYLPLLEGLTLLAVLVLVGVNFRSVVAPLLALAGSAVAFGITLRVAGLAGVVTGLSVPAELQPLLVALLLGVVTDYTIFYLSALEQRLGSGRDRRTAVRLAVASFTPIILVAGLTVAAGTGSLVAAGSGFFRALGPALALSVLIGVLVSVTLVPACLGILGERALWPRRTRPVPWMPGPGPSRLVPARGGGTLVRQLVRPGVAAAVITGCLVLLLAAAAPLHRIDLGVGFTGSLPADDPVRRTSEAAGKAFAAGITSPTTVLLEGPGVARQTEGLRRLQATLQRQPEVATVFGPEQVRAFLGGADSELRSRLRPVLSRDGDVARMVVVLRSDPLDADAVDALASLRDRLPDLVTASGLPGTRIGLAGDTALSLDLVEGTSRDLWRVALAALVINLLLLVVFLRALVAPLYLLLANLLAVAASLGITVWVFQDLLGSEGLTFYVPFAAAVLLMALGSDYNIFGVGHLWEEARRRPLREAVVAALPQTTRAITAAAITLAVSFGLLVLIPLRPFRELALVLTVGILLDAVVVRSLLVPCSLTLVGRFSAWPSRQFLETEPAGHDPVDDSGEAAAGHPGFIQPS